MHEKETGQRRKAAIIVNIVLFFLLAGVLLICFAPFLFLAFLSWQPYKYTEISVSPTGEYTVAVKSTDGQWSFGPAKAKVIAGGGRHWETYETKIADDGGRGGVRIFWLNEDTARVVLYGSEQTDEIVTVTFSDNAPILEAVQLPNPEPVPEEVKERAVHVLERVSILDGEHVFWVGLCEGEDSPDTTMVVIYDLYRQEIVQIFEDTSQTPNDMQNWGGLDDNEDGFTDFYYMSEYKRVVYLWDPQTQRFVQDSADVRKVSGETVCTLDLDVGDGVHRFRVEIAEREGAEESRIPIQVSIYPEDGGEAVQAWEDVFYSNSMEWMTLTVQDVNFDGCLDFSYPYMVGFAYGGTAYLVWDAETEQFVRDPYGLEYLTVPRFDQEEQLIETWWHGGVETESAYYRYFDGELTCVRRLMIQRSLETRTAVLIVEDYDERTGTLEEVYRAEGIPDNSEVDPSTEEFSRWSDLNYHGEG